MIARAVGIVTVALATCGCDRTDETAPRSRASSDVSGERIPAAASATAVGPRGMLTIDFPERIAGEPVSVSWTADERWLQELPSTVSVPLDQDVTVWSSRHSGKHFEKKLKLTAAAPSASVTIAFEGRPPLGLFGFKRSELPESTGFTPTPEHKVPPASLVFQLGAAQSGDAGVEFGIDRAGDVVVVKKAGGATVHLAVGRIDAKVLATMVNAAKQAADDERVFVGVGCFDCGYASITFSRMSDGKRVLSQLATDGEGRRRVRSSEGEQVLLWFLAVRERTGKRFWGDRR
jgi:hypothetical protein